MTAAAFSEQHGTPSPLFSESDIADRFVQSHSKTLRYVAEWGQWMAYDGQRWREEKTLLAFDLVRSVCRELAYQSNQKHEPKNLMSAKTIAAVERIAKADRRIAAE